MKEDKIIVELIGKRIPYANGIEREYLKVFLNKFFFKTFKLIIRIIQVDGSSAFL
jgi:hypothetical protein